MQRWFVVKKKQQIYNLFSFITLRALVAMSTNLYLSLRAHIADPAFTREELAHVTSSFCDEAVAGLRVEGNADAGVAFDLVSQALICGTFEYLNDESAEDPGFHLVSRFADLSTNQWIGLPLALRLLRGVTDTSVEALIQDLHPMRQTTYRHLEKPNVRRQHRPAKLKRLLDAPFFSAERVRKTEEGPDFCEIEIIKVDQLLQGYVRRALANGPESWELLVRALSASSTVFIAFAHPIANEIINTLMDFGHVSRLTWIPEALDGTFRDVAIRYLTPPEWRPDNSWSDLPSGHPAFSACASWKLKFQEASGFGVLDLPPQFPSLPESCVSYSQTNLRRRETVARLVMEAYVQRLLVNSRENGLFLAVRGDVETLDL